MSTKTRSMQFVDKRELPLPHGLRLSGIYQKIAVLLWLLITTLSGISWMLSTYSLNVWDRVPAAESSRYFPEMTLEEVQTHADWQNTVLQAGFSLSGYALLLRWPVSLQVCRCFLLVSCSSVATEITLWRP